MILISRGSTRAATLALLLCVPSCSATSAAKPAHRVEVVAALYPLAWVAEQIGGDRVAVRDLTPAGAEPHDLEITADDIDRIGRADLVITVGGSFQPAVESAAGQRSKRTVRAIEVAHDPVDRPDPHVWLDPELMRAIAENVKIELIADDPQGRAGYAANALSLDRRLRALDRDIRTALTTCAGGDLVTSHAAFGRFATRYGLRPLALSGIDPDAEPDARRMSALVQTIRSRRIATIFAEATAPSKPIAALARESGARVAVLTTIETRTKEDQRSDADYLSLMRRNVAAIRAGLGCR